MHASVCAPRRSSIHLFTLRVLALSIAALLYAAGLRAQTTAPRRSVMTAQNPAGWTACSSPDDQGQDAPLQESAGQAQLIVHEGTMSLDVRACTLTQVLSLIAAHTGVRIAVSDALPPSPRSLRTPSQSIEATLRELLRETDVFMLYASDSGAGQRLTALWVYPRGSTHDVVPVPPEQWASTRELEQQLAGWSPDLRGRAIEALIARGGDAALPQVFVALADGNPDIRLRTLDAALTAGLDVPLPQLHALVLNDPSPEVRLRALQALEERPDSAAAIEAATHDSDTNVRREAQGIARRLDQARR
jgi:hypothetical protein